MLFGVVTVLTVRYLYWRISGMPAATCSLRTLVLYVFLAYETWAMVFTVREMRFYTKTKDRRMQADACANWYGSAPPSVALLIPTYNESPEILRRALLGAQRQDHSNTRVWLLDDGRREWARNLAQELGAEYLTRSNNHHFKSGNLNHALEVLANSQEPPEFFAVVDCDFVSGRYFVSRTLSLMQDETIGVVQTKQIYYNEDLFQYGLRAGTFLPDWLRFAFNFVFPSKEAVGAAHCCGTSFLARTDYFRRSGGFPTETLAEDQLATLALRELGYKTVYLNEGHTFGILAEGLGEFLTQRFRWCLGVVQNMYTRWGAFSPGVRPFRQRIAGVEKTLVGPFCIFMKVMMMGFLIAYWFCGPSVLPIPINADGYASRYLPLWTMQTAAVLWMSGGTELPILTEARVWIASAAILRATWRGLSRSKNNRFEVTDKGVLKDHVTIHWNVLLPLLLAVVLLVSGILYSCFSPFAPTAHAAVGIYVFTVYCLFTLMLAAALCIEPPQRRCEQRFVSGALALVGFEGRRISSTVLNVSASGILLRAREPLEIGLGHAVEISGFEGQILRGRLARSVDANTVALMLEPGPSRDELTAIIYSEKYVNPPAHPEVLRVYLAIFRKLIWDPA